MRQFDAPGPMYILQSGLLQVLKMKQGGSVLLAEMGSGAHLGELSALLHTPRNATAQALTDVVVLEISVAHMRELIRTEPAFAQEIGDNLVGRAGYSTSDAAALLHDLPA